MLTKSKPTTPAGMPVGQAITAPQRLADALHPRVPEDVGRARNLPFRVIRLLNQASDVVDGANAAAVLVRESQLMRKCGEENMRVDTEDSLLKLIIVSTEMLSGCFEETAEWLYDEPDAEVRHD